MSILCKLQCSFKQASIYFEVFPIWQFIFLSFTFYQYDFIPCYTFYFIISGSPIAFSTTILKLPFQQFLSTSQAYLLFHSWNINLRQKVFILYTRYAILFHTHIFQLNFVDMFPPKLSSNPLNVFA